MLHLSRIVVGVDVDLEARALTTGSTRAVEIAHALAAAWDARVDLVHATGPEPSFGVSRILRAEQLRLRAAGLSCTTLVANGDPAVVLQRTVVRTRADLLIVGRHDQTQRHAGWGGVARVLIGHSPCALLVVAPGPASAFRNVLVASDLSPVGPSVLAHADLFARTLEADLHALHVWQLPFGAHHGPAESPTIEARLQQEAVAKLRHQLDLAHVESTPTLHVGLGAPLATTRRALRSLRPDLVVLGSTSRPLLGAAVLGHTASRILHRWEGSLLIVPPTRVTASLTG